MFIYFSEIVQITIISIVASIITQFLIKELGTEHKKITLFFVCFIVQVFIDYTVLLYVPYKTAKTPLQVQLNESSCIWLEFILGMVFYDNCLKDIYTYIGNLLKRIFKGGVDGTSN